MINEYKTPIRGKTVAKKPPLKKAPANKLQPFLTKKNLQWLGIFLVFLAFLSFIFMIMSNRRHAKTIYTSKLPDADITEITEIDDDENIFEQLDFQKVHNEYIHSYLNLIESINAKVPSDSENGTISIDVKQDILLFENYKTAHENYTMVLKKVEEHEKAYKKACYKKMKTLIHAVLEYDRVVGKRVTKFDPEKMIDSGVIDEMPFCPRGGDYSIIYKDGRRVFNCSIHGVLKN